MSRFLALCAALLAGALALLIIDGRTSPVTAEAEPSSAIPPSPGAEAQPSSPTPPSEARPQAPPQSEHVHAPTPPTPDNFDLRRSAVVRAVEATSPAVVNISTEILVDNPFSRWGGPSLFESFFGRRTRRREFVQNSLGSGVIVSPEGYLLTNEHVISAASRVTVTLQDERQIEADIVGADRPSDLAVLKLAEEGPWPYVPLGRSDDLLIGETVIAIGNPFGLKSTVTTGVVSALGRSVAGPDGQATAFTDFIQTDAAINPGNSGGALINILGELVGINSQIVAKGQNLGFAIPVSRARTVMNELIDFGVVRPYWTGMVVSDIDANMSAYLGLEEVEGVVVRRVDRDSPASRQNIQRFDVVLSINGDPIDNRNEMETALSQHPIGENVTMEIFRDGTTFEVSVPLLVFPKERTAALTWEVLGLEVRDHRQGVMIERVRRNSPAQELRSGLLIVGVNGRKIRSLEDFENALPSLLQQRSVALVLATRRHLLNYPLQLW